MPVNPINEHNCLKRFNEQKNRVWIIRYDGRVRFDESVLNLLPQVNENESRTEIIIDSKAKKYLAVFEPKRSLHSYLAILSA